MKQEEWDFITKHKKQLKAYSDQNLINEYGRILMNLARRVEDAESQLAEYKDKYGTL